MGGMRDVVQSLVAEFSTQPVAWRAQAGGRPGPGDDQPRPVPGKDVPIEEPEVVQLPEESPDPNPKHNNKPPKPAS